MIYLIVESPNKIKKIEHILGDGYKVEASVGHIIDLDPHEMSIDIENNFEPRYVIIEGKGDIIVKLKKICNKCEDIFLASDKDPEGEMIAWSLAKELDIKNPKRIVFNEITEEAIKYALQHPCEINQDIVNSQKTRRMLDRLIGFRISKILQQTLKASSAGRVQSVVVELIVDREKEINDFFNSDIMTYFKINAEINCWKCNLMKNKKIAKINNYEETKEIFNKIILSQCKIDCINIKTSKQSPSPPFTTSTLQQEASRKMGFSSKRTMQSAQRLYEGGYISYMRTDSINLSNEILSSIEKYVLETYGESYSNRKQYKSKKQNTKEAHEAIRPSNINILELIEERKIGLDEKKLYNLIWKRTIASQMAPAQYKVIIIKINYNKNNKDNENYYFETKLEQLMFTGFLEVYGGKIDDEINIPDKDTEIILNSVHAIQEYEKPPSRYDVASLLNKIDPTNLNIGRPSTYSSIIEKIQNSGYVKIDNISGFEKNVRMITWQKESDEIKETEKTINIGEENNKFIPTEIGKIVNEFLVENFPDIMNYQFTAQMEEKLDIISEGKINWIDVLKECYNVLCEEIANIKDKVYIDKNLRIIGCDDKGREISATIARFGPVVKVCRKGKKITYAPVRLPLTIEEITLEEAIKLLEFPIEMGKLHRKNVSLCKGRYGFYLTVSKEKIPLKDYSEENARKITIDDVEKLLEEKRKNILWEQKDGSILYTILNGPHGTYIRKKQKGKNINRKLPIDVKIEDITLDIVKEIMYRKKKRFFKRNKN